MKRILSGGQFTEKKLPLSKEWTLAVKLLENLKNISGYLQDISNVEGEIAALAALFLMWGDWEQMPELKKRFSIFLYESKKSYRTGGRKLKRTVEGSG